MKRNLLLLLLFVCYFSITSSVQGASNPLPITAPDVTTTIKIEKNQYSATKSLSGIASANEVRYIFPAGQRLVDTEYAAAFVCTTEYVQCHQTGGYQFQYEEATNTLTIKNVHVQPGSKFYSGVRVGNYLYPIEISESTFGKTINVTFDNNEYTQVNIDFFNKSEVESIYVSHYLDDENYAVLGYDFFRTSTIYLPKNRYGLSVHATKDNSSYTYHVVDYVPNGSVDNKVLT